MSHKIPLKKTVYSYNISWPYTRMYIVRDEKQLATNKLLYTSWASSPHDNSFRSFCLPSEERSYLYSIQPWAVDRYQFVATREGETFQKMKTMLAFFREGRQKLDKYVCE